jgi:hypothetical protein
MPLGAVACSPRADSLNLTITKAEFWTSIRPVNLMKAPKRFPPRFIKSFHRHRKQHAFTRTDLLALTGACALLAAIAYSSLASVRPASNSALCVSNLRETGQAIRAWATDRHNRFPWQTPSPAGGTMDVGTWRSFQVLSNEVSSPRVFVCPSDGRMPATDFGSSLGGLAHPGFRNNSISYFISLDSFPDRPSHYLSGDRHLAGGTPNQGCRFVSIAVTYGVGRDQALAGRIQWTNALHGPNLGNLAMNDGSVASGPSRTLQEIVMQMEPDVNYLHHLLLPQ